jgi:Ca2+-binding RTX toxin-like protein
VLLKANEQTGMGNATISTADGKDRIEAGDGADVISTAGGNDTIIDLAGASTSINAGKGDDLINLAGSTFGDGSVDGGLGSNTLIASGADLSALTLVNLQVLEAGAGLRALASQLEGFERIVAGTSAPDATVRLTLVAAGARRVLELSSELSQGGSRKALLFGSSDAESLVLGSGNDSVNGGAGNDSITGNAGADVLLGGAGKDTLLGGGRDDILCGGASSDRMTGGAGADRFVFVEHKVGDADTITDFTQGQDKIVVARADFGNFDTQGGLQVLPSAWFRANAGGNATDASDRFVYDTATGRLYFDVDGVNGLAKTLIATLNANPLLSGADFDVQDTINFGF